ncbi:MAG: cation diffusion facilitator family transporter [Bdellovibrionales bacterium]
MGLGHSHHHHHDYQEDRAQFQRSLLWVLGLTLTFMFVEVGFGFFTNSLALLADGVHMLTDVASLALTFVAFIWSQRPATKMKTFGFYRVEILAAFVNGLFLMLLSAGIIWSAWSRLSEPLEIKSTEMLIVACIGLLVNLIAGFILFKQSHKNLNLQGAFLHVMGDTLASVGTIVASCLIIWKGWTLADPVVSLVISVIIIISSYRLVADAVHIILQGVPANIDPLLIDQELRQLKGVTDLHHLHVWSLSSNMNVLTVHLVVSGGCQEHTAFLSEASELVRKKFGISHTTIQIETTSLESKELHFP